MTAGSPESLSIPEIAAPVRVERVSVRLHLKVALDGDLGGINQPSPHRTLRVSQYREAPCASSKPVPVSIYDPDSGLIRMTTLRPSTERVSEDHPTFRYAGYASI